MGPPSASCCRKSMLSDSCRVRAPVSSSRLPMKPFLLAVRDGGRDKGDGVYAGVTALGVRGDVGGLARGAELMECAARLCAFTEGRGAAAVVGGRVFVNVTVTANGSPAKYDDCAGVTTTRIPVSELVLEDPGTASMSCKRAAMLIEGCRGQDTVCVPA